MSTILESMLRMTEATSAAAEDDVTPDPGKLLERAKLPASVLAVDRGIKWHADHCPTSKAMRKLLVIGAFVLGIFTVVQVVAIAYTHSVVGELRATRGRSGSAAGVLSSAQAAEAPRP